MIYIILSIICVILLIALFKKRSNYNEEILQEQRQLESLKKEELNHLNSIKHLEERERDYEAFFKSEDRRKQTYVEQQKMACDLELEAYRASRKSEIDQRLITLQLTQENECKERYKKFDEQQKQSYNIKWQELEEKINQQTLILRGQEQLIAEYKAKQDAINEEIRRKREVEANKDFYSIQISDTNYDDLLKLQSIKRELHNTTILDKLIYDAFVSKPVTEMLKRVLGDKKPCGVYKITRLSTGEIYIGQSVDIYSRWTQHCKSAFGTGTISHSLLHTKMEEDGLFNNFTFELLEEVPKEKLHEREKYWIEYYNTINYGLNQRNG